MSTTTDELPQPSALVEVRGQKWVVNGIDPGKTFTVGTFQGNQEGRCGETPDVLWELEPGLGFLPDGAVPEVAGIVPEQLAAFLDMEAGLLVRGGAAPQRVAEHVAELRSRGVLERIRVGDH